MVGVDTHVVVLQVEGVLAELDMLEFVFVEVRPAPQPCINDMRKTFPPRHLRREHSIVIVSKRKDVLTSFPNHFSFDLDGKRHEVKER